MVPLSSLVPAIGALDLARDTTNVKPAKEVFESVSRLLTTINVRFLLDDVGLCLTD